ncbi:hypothetical protein WA026_003086 [Henosepilachna vigintioctopunctata]|uniref:Protein slender lobes n=1 Tax=Henosepilachna vigintioctopunctata TaxID=420089 RepID=A0AAW1TM48_9CUCU
MSKKAAIKETLSEENIDAPVRRSTRNSVNPTSTNSAAPKSIGTRRGSGSSSVEKKKPHNADSSPVELAGRRKTRRTSTEEDIKSTPIKTRRSSISKIIEEDKKVLSSPKTPSRKVGSRAASTSPTNTTEVPARRTRRSISASQENEVVEQIPLRRSTRRRSSVDTQEDVSNEEVLTKSKPTPRRRRSNSVDENEETTKNDVKSKTKRLYSEDNQLEPIEEHETEVTEKSEKKTDETVVEMKRDHNLSVIEESEDKVQKDSHKIIKDIDNMLTNMISSPKPKTVTEKITTRSIFSPMTPKPILSEQNTDVDCEIISSDSDTENELPKSRQSENIKIVLKNDSLKNTSPLKNQSKEESDKETRKTPLSSAKSNKNDSLKENFITNGSDDSFTLNSSKILDKIQTSNNETDEDVFTSPGSNKENNCINVPPKKPENRVVLKEKKSSELSDLDLEDDVFATKTSLINDDEPMEVDCEDENVEDRSKIDIPDCSDKESKMLSFDKTEENDMKEQGQEDSEISVQKVTSSGNTNGITETKDSSGRSPENVVINRNEVKSNTPLEDSGNDASCSSTKSNLEVENSFTSLNSNDDNKLDLSFNIFKSPKAYSKQKNSLTSSPGRCADKFANKKESKDSSVSSDFSIQLIDSDEEDEAGNKRKSVGEQNSNTSKQPQIQIEGNSISESETTISANTNTSMRESETEEGIEEVNNDAAAKEHAELSLEEVVAGSPKKKSKSDQPILEENSAPSVEKSKYENAIEDSTPLLKQKINSQKSESNLNEFEKSNPIGKSPRQSFNNKSQDDGDKDTLDIKGVKCEKNSMKIISSPSNNKGQKQCAELSNIVESITESELNSSVKVNVIQEIKLSKSIVTELGNSEDSSSDTYCKKKSKPSHSLNSGLVEINSYVEVEQVEDELIDSEQKTHFLNESSVADEAETEKRHEKSKLNDSLTKKRNENQNKKKREIDEINACEEIENSEDGNQKEEIVDVIEDNTKTSPTNVEVENQKKQFNPESKQDDGEKKEPISDVKSKKDKSTPRIRNRNSKVSDEITSARSCDISLSESDVDTDSISHKSNRASKIEENESSEVAISPLKSKIEKMKSCGINFVNPSPTATRIRLDEKTSKKLDDYLNEKFSALQNEEQESQSDENKSEEDENESSDVHNSSQFLDDMAEEGEEDTPSEGSNDIVDEGESINSKDSEIDSDDTYDSNDSFLVKDDGDDLDLLPGDEYDLGDTPELTKKASKKRRRIVKNLNTSSEEESSPLSSRVSFSDKVEVIPEKKSPRKEISPIKITDKANKNENNFYTDLQDAQHQESPKEEPHTKIPSICVNLINDSSEDERPASKQNETPAFDETIRSLMEDEKSSTPNVSFKETSNTSRQNNSLRSSSIIIHENVNINEIKEGLLSEKLQQVVSVFCAGIRSSDGNISMNVSLDYIENPSKECDNIKVNDVEQIIKSPVCEKAEAKSRHSSYKSEDNNDSINRENSRKRKLSNISPKNIQKQPSLNNDFIEELPVEDLSVLNASFNDETSMLDESSRIMDSGSAKKKRRSSNRKEKQLGNKNIVTSDISCENDEETANMEEKFEESSLKTEELQVSTSKKRRRSSNKIERPLNENLEKSLGKKDFTEKKVEDNSDHDQTKHRSCKSPSTGEKQESKHSNYEQKLCIVKYNTDVESEPVKKKKKHNKRKCIEKTSKEVLPEIVTSKRKKLVEMQCDELSANDLRHKIPSFKETSEESNAALKKKKLKRLQSDLKRDLKSTLLSGLVTDVKNRPRRMLKPSIEMDAKDWLIEEAPSKPSSANLSKSSFNFNKIDAKDFKNQILYDSRIKREPTSAFLRKKGHY